MGRGSGSGAGRGQGGGGAGRGQGQGPGRGDGAAASPEGACVCPACGHREPHLVGQPCTSKACPKCGTQMMRG